MNAEFINGLSNNFTVVKITAHQRVNLNIVEDVDFGLSVIGLLLTVWAWGSWLFGDFVAVSCRKNIATKLANYYNSSGCNIFNLQ